MTVEELETRLTGLAEDISEFISNWDVTNMLAVTESKTYQILQDLKSGKIDWLTAGNKVEKYLDKVIESYGDFESLVLEIEEVIQEMGDMYVDVV